MIMLPPIPTTPRLDTTVTKIGGGNWTSMRVLQWLEKTTEREIPFLKATVFANHDGTVVFTNSRGQYKRFSYKEAEEIAEWIRHAAIAARLRCEQLSGTNKWKVVAVDGDRALIEHRERRRWFRPMRVGKRRRPGACDSCKAELTTGARAWREAEPKRYDNWRDVRLCEACVAEKPKGLRVVP